MKKKSFALSWGRKMFFGSGWALTSIVALNYLQSMILPQTLMGFIYFVLTFVGHYGLILALGYFLLYAPVIMILPTYYVARIWSITIILLINLLIFLDSYLFVKFRFHIDSFMWGLLTEDSGSENFGFVGAKKVLLLITLFVALIVFWFRGEKLWRSMQARFSNPIKNWYLVIIFLCLVGGHGMYMYGQSTGARFPARLSQLFPFYYPLSSEVIGKEVAETQLGFDKKPDYKDFYYPKSELKCTATAPKNIMMIVVDGWKAKDLDIGTTPNLAHYTTHSVFFRNHFSGGNNFEDGMFSLFYSLPATYKVSALNEGTSPVFLKQLENSKMKLTFYKSAGDESSLPYLGEREFRTIDALATDLRERKDSEDIEPFMMYVSLRAGNLVEKDEEVRMILEQMYATKLHRETIIVVTGSHGETKSTPYLGLEEVQTPLLILWPGKDPKMVETATSHFDVVPTLLKENWKCKNPVEEYSLGRSLFSTDERSSLVTGTYSKLGIVDLSQRKILTIEGKSSLEAKDFESDSTSRESSETPLILSTLESMTSFYERQQ